MHRLRSVAPIFALSVVLAAGGSRAEDGPPAPPPRTSTRCDAAIVKALDALRQAQAEDGHWECREFPTACTAMAGLALLAGDDGALADPAVHRALRWLLAHVKDGRAPQEAHTWIHVQGFVTLCLAEAYARAIRSDPRPDLSDVCDLEDLEATLVLAVRAIEDCQGGIGGWWYVPGGGDQHEGSTTVCAVQALRAARNAGIAVRPEVLERGFEYLKRTQNADGGFQYQLGRPDSMVAGTAGAVATLALMDKLDYPVLIAGAKHLVALGPEAITSCPFPEYGQLYAVLGMKLVAEDMGEVAPGTRTYVDRLDALLLAAQTADGAWESGGWIGAGQRPYATSLAVLALGVRAERLTIFRRAG